MSNKERNAKRERDEANYSYFQSLANSRFSLERLPTMAVLTAILLGLGLLLLWSLVYLAEDRAFLLWFDAQLVVIGFSLVVWVSSAFKTWVYRFQVFSTGLMGFFSLGGWVYGTCLMAAGIASYVGDGAGSTAFHLPLFVTIAPLGLLYVCGAFVVHVLLLRKRLREGHSAERTMGNFGAVSSVYHSKSVWIIFAVAVIGPNVLTGGQYVMMTIGLLGFLLFGAVMPGLTVEFAYLTYLKSRDRRYWEKRPPKRVVTRKQVSRVLLRVGKWVLIFIAVCVVIGILNEVLATD